MMVIQAIRVIVIVIVVGASYFSVMAGKQSPVCSFLRCSQSPSKSEVPSSAKSVPIRCKPGWQTPENESLEMLHVSQISVDVAARPSFRASARILLYFGFRCIRMSHPLRKEKNKKLHNHNSLGTTPGNLALHLR